MGLPDSDRIPRVPPYSGRVLRRFIAFAYRAFTLFRRPSQFRSANNKLSYYARNPLLPFILPFYPNNATVKALHITGLGSSGFARRYFRNLFLDFFSSGYLDGSLPRVYTLLHYFIHVGITYLLICWITPFGYPGIIGCLLLPQAFRSLPRPSSPLSS